MFAYSLPLNVDLYYVMYRLHGNCFDSDSKYLNYITYLKRFLSNLTASCSKQRFLEQNIFVDTRPMGIGLFGDTIITKQNIIKLINNFSSSKYNDHDIILPTPSAYRWIAHLSEADVLNRHGWHDSGFESVCSSDSVNTNGNISTSLRNNIYSSKKIPSWLNYRGKRDSLKKKKKKRISKSF